MQLSSAQRFRLGVFIALGAGLFVVTLAVLTGLQVWQTRNVYKVRFRENVSGLEISSPVKYQGFRVGRVEKLSISVDDPGAIEISLALDPSVVLYEGTQAMLDTTGITGLKTINLTPGDPRQPVLHSGALIPTTQSLYGQITEQASAILNRIDQVAQAMANLTRSSNMERVDRMVESLENLTRTVDIVATESRVPFGDALRGVSAAGQNLATAAADTSHTLHSLDASVSSTLEVYRRPLEKINPDDIAATLTAIKGITQQLNTYLSSPQTKQAVAQFTETLRQANELFRDTDLAIRSGREDFTTSLSYIRQASEDLREFSRMIAQDPSILFRGREVRQ